MVAHRTEGPGLGIEIDEEAALRYPYKPCPFRHYTGALTEIRPPDALPFYRTKNTASKVTKH